METEGENPFHSLVAYKAKGVGQTGVILRRIGKQPIHKKSQQNFALYQDKDLQALRFIPTSDDELRSYLKCAFMPIFLAELCIITE